MHVIGPSGLAGIFEGRYRAWTFARRHPAAWLSSTRLLRRYVLEVRPDVVHLHLLRWSSRPCSAIAGDQDHLPTPQLGVRSGPRLGEAHRMGIRGIDEVWWRNGVFCSLCGELEEGRRWRVLDRGAFVVGVPIDTDHFRPPDSRTSTTPVRIVCVGRGICRQKNQTGPLAAWERHPIDGARLVFVGPGDTAEIERVARTNFGSSLLCVSGVDDVRAGCWTRQLRSVPSLYEGQLVAMAEALACGVPVVSTAVNGSDVLTESDPPCGATVPLGDMTGLLHETKTMLGSADFEAISMSARGQALASFEPRMVISRVLDAYEEVCAARPLG